MIKNKTALNFQTNYPRQHRRKCINGSMGNMHTDVRV